MLYSVDILSRVIIEDAYRDANLIIENAKKEADKIKNSAHEDVSKLKKMTKNSLTQKTLISKKSKIISLAEFKARCEILMKKEKTIDRVLSGVKQEFFSIADNDNYPDILKRLILIGLRYLDEEAEDFVCQVNIKDSPLISNGFLNEINKKTGKGLSMDKDFADIAGGAVIYTADYRVFYNNSFEAIFERAKDKMRFIVAECIFSGN